MILYKETIPNEQNKMTDYLIPKMFKDWDLDFKMKITWALKCPTILIIKTVRVT